MQKWLIIFLMVIGMVETTSALCFPGTLNNPFCLFEEKEEFTIEASIPDFVKNITILNDGSKFRRVNPREISIEKDGVVFNISSDIQIHELGDIRETKEWEYKDLGKHFEILNSKNRIWFYTDDNDTICDVVPISRSYDSGGIPTGASYYCVNYPNGSNRKIRFLDNYTARIDFDGPYDPSSDVVTTNMSLFFPMNETSGLFAKNLGSAQNLNGTLITNTVNIFENDTDDNFRMRVLGATSGFPNAFKLNTTNNDELTTPSDGDASVSFVINIISDTNAKIIRWNDAADDVVEYFSSTDKLRWKWYDRNLDFGPFLNNTVYHICLSFNNSINLGRAYVNGTLNKTNTNMDQEPGSNPGDFYLGHRDFNQVFNGTLGNVRFWNGLALSSEECSTVFDNDLNVTEVAAEPPEESDTTPPIVNTTFNTTTPRNIDVINFTGNVTDETELSTANWTINFSTGTIFMNYSLSGTTAQVSNKTDLRGIVVGEVLNFTLYVTDTSNNVKQNSTKFTITDGLVPVVNTTLNITNPNVNDIINFTGNVTDETGLFSANWTVNLTTGTLFMNYSLSGTTAQVSNKTQLTSGGVFNFTLYVTDTNNNVKQNSTLITVTDNVVPVVNTTFNKSITNIIQNDVLNFTGNVTDETGLLFVNITNNQSGVITYSNYTVSGTSVQIENTTAITSAAGSVINFTMYATDTSNNVKQNSTKIEVTAAAVPDTTPPIVNTTLNITSPNINDVINFTGNVTDETGLLSANWTVNLTTGTVFSNYSLSGTTAQVSNKTQLVSSGVFNFTLFVTDTSNNVKQNSTLITVALDTILPTLNVTINNTRPEANEVINITAKLSDNIGLDTCQFFYNGTSDGSFLIKNKSVGGTSDECGQNFTVDLLGGGVFNFTVIVNDTSGNIRKSRAKILGFSLNDSSTLRTASVFFDDGTFYSTTTDITTFDTDFSFTERHAWTIPDGFNFSEIVGFAQHTSNTFAVVFFTNQSFLNASTNGTYHFDKVGVKKYTPDSGFTGDNIIGVLYDDGDGDIASSYDDETHSTDVSFGAATDDTINFSNGPHTDTYPANFLTSQIAGYAMSNSLNDASVFLLNGSHSASLNVGSQSIALQTANDYTDTSERTTNIKNFVGSVITVLGEPAPPVPDVVDITVPIINGTINKSITNIFQNDIINATYNFTDDSGNITWVNISINLTGGIEYFNISINDSSLNTRETSAKFTISDPSGTILNISALASDNSSNMKNNDTIFTVTSADSCSCPSSGNFEVIDGDQCVISNECDIGNNKFRVLDGGMDITSTGVIRAVGCFVDELLGSLFVEDGGGLFCG